MNVMIQILPREVVVPKINHKILQHAYIDNVRFKLSHFAEWNRKKGAVKC